MIRAITAGTAEAAYRIIFNHVMDKGTLFVSEDGADCLKTDTIISHIVDPMEGHDELIRLSPLGPLAMEQYKNDFVNGIDENDERPMDFSYTYHERLFDYDFPECYDHINQINNIEEKIIKNPLSRRAVAVTWKPWEDIDSHDPPCLCMMKISVSAYTLAVNMSVVFRSHDILGGYPNNVYALSHLLKRIADETGRGVGYLEVVSFDPHIYMSDGDKIEALRKKLK